MKLPVKFQAEALHRTYSRYFRTNMLMLYGSIFYGTNINGTIIHRDTFI